MTTLLYALGGGRGHVVRTGGLARAFAEVAEPVRWLVPEELAAFARARLLGLDGVEVVPIAKPSARVVLAQRLHAEIGRVRRLVVDCFPEGKLGELRELSLPPVSVALLRLRRDLTPLLSALPAYAAAFDLEPALDWLPPAVATSFGVCVRPVVVGDADVALMVSEHALAPFLRRLAERLERRGLRVSLQVPGEKLEPGVGAPVVVGGAGYNLSWELAVAGALHVALPQPRRHDDQYRRARYLAAVPGSPEETEHLVLRCLGSGPRPRHIGRSYRDLASAVLAL